VSSSDSRRRWWVGLAAVLALGWASRPPLLEAQPHPATEAQPNPQVSAQPNGEATEATSSPVPDAATELETTADPAGRSAEPPASDSQFGEGLAGARALDESRLRSVLAGLAALVGIAVVGLALIAGIVVWAARLRRLNRLPPVTKTAANEFWFLRPPKPPVSETGPEQRPDSRRN
jgi:hypothetical protein